MYALEAAANQDLIVFLLAHAGRDGATATIIQQQALRGEKVANALQREGNILAVAENAFQHAKTHKHAIQPIHAALDMAV